MNYTNNKLDDLVPVACCVDGWMEPASHVMLQPPCALGAEGLPTALSRSPVCGIA